MSNDINKNNAKADYGIFLIAIPIVSTMMIWLWVSGMSLLQRPGDTMSLIMLATVLGTAIIAAVEASKLGMVGDRKKGTYGPVAWFFLITLLWVVCYPVYLFKRRHYGLKNLVIPGLISALMFIISWSIMGSAIDAQIAEVQQQIETIR